MLIDTHAHIYSSTYDNIDEIISNAKINNVKKVFNCAEDIKTSLEIIDLCKKYNDFFYAVIGVHPENICELKNDYIDKLNKMIDEKNVVAIGEIGLDYYHNKENKDDQIKMFKEQLDIAQEKNLPVIIHSRESTEDMIKILKDYKVKGIMHCFNGSVETAREYIKMGFLLGIGGVITFKNCNLINVIRILGIDNIVYETDSPFLSPSIYRGKKNQSAYIIETIEFISKELNIPENVLIEKSYENIKRVFNI